MTVKTINVVIVVRKWNTTIVISTEDTHVIHAPKQYEVKSFQSKNYKKRRGES